MMAGNKTRPLVLITNKIISDGPTVKELMASCDIQQYTGPGFMTREDILAAIKTADAALIQSEDIFDRELIEEAGKKVMFMFIFLFNSVGNTRNQMTMYAEFVSIFSSA